MSRTSPKAFAKTSSNFFPFPEDVGRFNNCGLCRAILALVGEANDGRLSDRFLIVAETAIRLGVVARLGVVGASTGADVVGDVLRRFGGGVRCIVSVEVFTSVP